MLTLYNTLTRSLEPFTPITAEDVRFFVCGPTVYGPMHAGHAKTYTQFDLIARVLKRAYPTLRYAMNITDVDDKIIKKSQAEGRSAIEVAREWEAKFWEAMSALGNDQVSEVHRAHDHIPEVIDQVARLLAAKKAYVIADSGVYFDLSTFASHGELARRADSGAEVSRLTNGPVKRNAGDFVLWKFAKPDEPSWPAPFGVGRPGWHIEDTAITEKHLGASYDIHGGATDLIFPHHEAEIAQMEALTNEPLVGYWLHTGLLNVDGKKMGKSLNNFITVDAMVEAWGAKNLRYAFVSTHYRSTMDLSDGVISQAQATRERVENFYRTQAAEGPAGAAWEAFWVAVLEDVNTPKAFAGLLKVLRTAPETITKGDLDAINELLGGVFEFELAIPEAIQVLAGKRAAAREAKDWPASDALREELSALGWTVRDEPGGYVLTPLGV